MIKSSSFAFDVPAEAATLKEACNIRAVYVFEQGKDVVMVGHEPSTGLKTALHINQYSGAATACDRPSLMKGSGTFFSLYIGQIAIDDVRRLMFASAVRGIEWGEKPIFMVEEVVVYTLNPFAFDAPTTRSVRASFENNCLFSYTNDLSLGTGSGDRRGWPFWLNRRAQWDLLSSAREWAVPLVPGSCRRHRASAHEAGMLFRPSIFNCHPPYRQDKDALWDFFCPPSFFSLEMHAAKESLVIGLRLIFCHFPRGASPLRARAAGDAFESVLQPHKISRFYQFMHLFAGCDRFYVTGSRACVERVRPWEGCAPLDGPESERGAKGGALPEELRGIVSAYEEFSGSAEEDFHTIANGLKAAIRDHEGGKTIACAIVVEQYSDFCFYIAQLAYAELHHKLQRRLPQQELREPVDLIADLEFIKARIDALIDAERRGRSCLGDAPPLFLRSFYGRKSELSRGYRSLFAEKRAEVFSARPLSLGILTHNTSGMLPGEAQAAGLNYGRLPGFAQTDVLVVALQEIVEMKGYNIGLILRSENSGSCAYWEQRLRALFPQHVFAARTSLMGLYLAVLVHASQGRDLQLAASKHALFPLGFLSLANKGALFLNFRVNYENIGVLNCHLNAGSTPADATKRAASLARLCETIFSRTRSGISFLVGDFNFRRAADDFAREAAAASPSTGLALLRRALEGDEWARHRRAVPALRGLEEAPIEFFPTYKLRPFQEMRYAEERCPAWTDRVLFCNHDGLAMSDVCYGSDPKTTFSDHQPVFFTAQLSVREIDMVKFRDFFK